MHSSGLLIAVLVTAVCVLTIQAEPQLAPQVSKVDIKELLAENPELKAELAARIEMKKNIAKTSEQMPSNEGADKEAVAEAVDAGQNSPSASEDKQEAIQGGKSRLSLPMKSRAQLEAAEETPAAVADAAQETKPLRPHRLALKRQRPQTEVMEKEITSTGKETATDAQSEAGMMGKKGEQGEELTTAEDETSTVISEMTTKKPRARFLLPPRTGVVANTGLVNRKPSDQSQVIEDSGVVGRLRNARLGGSRTGTITKPISSDVEAPSTDASAVGTRPASLAERRGRFMNARLPPIAAGSRLRRPGNESPVEAVTEEEAADTATSSPTRNARRFPGSRISG